MNLVDRVIAGFKAQFFSYIVSAVVGGLLLVALARLLQPQGYGVFMLALTVFGSFQMIARLGIAGSAGRYVAEFKENSGEQLPHIVRFSFALNLGAIAITALAVIVSYRHIVELLGEPELGPFLIVGTLLLVFGTIQTYLKKVLQGLESIQFVAILKIIQPVSRLIFALGFVLLGFGAMGAYVGYIISSVLTTIIGASYLVYRLREFREPGSSIESGLRRRIVEYSVPLTATNSANVLEKRIDTLLVGFFLSSVEVGFYVVSDRIVRLIETPMSALGFTLSPMFGSEKAAGNIGQMSRLYETALVHSLLLYIPAAAGIILVAEPMIHLVFGLEYSGAIVVLQVLGVFVIFKAITKLTDNGLNYLGRARERAIVKGITSVLNVGLNIALIPVFGVVGAAIATVISYGLYTASNLYIISLELEMRPLYLIKQLVPIALITAAMAAVVYNLVTYISGWLTLFSVVGAGMGIWLLLSAATGMLDVRKLLSMFS